MAPVLIGFLLFIAFMSALLGRVWCGWACPQTVFIDGIFRKIENFIEGYTASQKLLDKSSWSLKKIGKKFLKWLLFFLISCVITHSFLAYLVGSDLMLLMIQHSPFYHPKAALLMIFSTGIIFFDFGWFREQFCIIACPYGRFQSLLLDSHSLIVAYDEKRGEPRKKTVADTSVSGDCISCTRCIQVCPTGIDIRRGIQMECIHCTACIDACDEVMLKLGKPKGLIRYDSEAGILQEKKKIWRPRIFVYALLMTCMLGILLTVVMTRPDIRLEVLRGSTPYQIDHEMGRTYVINHFRIHAYNHCFDPAKIEVNPLDSGVIFIRPILNWNLAGGKADTFDIFLKIPFSYLNKKKEILVNFDCILNNHKTLRILKALPVLGPLNTVENGTVLKIPDMAFFIS